MAVLEKIFVVSAPSGAGKTTLNQRIVRENPEIEISVSLTTRKKRSGEVHGKDYFFVSKEEFQKALDAGQMLEWADVHGNYYGTSKVELSKIADRGHNAILEIDVQGWLNAQPNLKRVISIFILPPSVEILAERLSGRGTDTAKDVKKRLQNAKNEIALAEKYDHFIINDNLEEAYQQLHDIMVKNKDSGSSLKDAMAHKMSLLAEFENLDIIK